MPCSSLIKAFVYLFGMILTRAQGHFCANLSADISKQVRVKGYFCSADMSPFQISFCNDKCTYK